jgi:hypothetical protein
MNVGQDKILMRRRIAKRCASDCVLKPVRPSEVFRRVNFRAGRWDSAGGRGSDPFEGEGATAALWVLPEFRLASWKALAQADLAVEQAANS